MDFRWIEWNIDHVAQHSVSTSEAEFVVESAAPPYPEDIGEEKQLVIGRGDGGRFLQVIFLLDDDGTIFVIHARPLTDKEKQRFKRRTR